MWIYGACGWCNPRAGAASVFVILCLGVLGTIGILGLVTDSAANEVTEECFGCYPYVELCPNGGHEDRTHTSAPFWQGQPFHGSCDLSDCNDDHFTDGCVESLAAAEELERAMPLLEEKRWAALATFMLESRTGKFNGERRALQFTGCGSMIAAHIPLAEHDAKQLAEEIAIALNE